MTLRWRLTLFYTTLLAGLLLVIAVTSVSVLHTNLLRGIESELESDVAQIATSVRETNLGDVRTIFGLDPFNVYAAVDLLLGVRPEEVPAIPTERFLTLRYAPVATTANLQPEQGVLPGQHPFPLSREAFLRLQRVGEVNVTRNVRLPGQEDTIPTLLHVQLLPYTYTNPVTGLSMPATAIAYVARDLSRVENTLNELRLVLLLVSLLGLALAGVGAYWLAGQALSPLRLVQRAAESISEKTLRQRVPEPNTGDEVESLAHALNGMLDRIERSFEAQRRFTSDASHELRTPVTAIGGHAGYLLRRTEPTEQQAESISIIKNEADRLSALIASLLELARSDSGVMQLRKQLMLARLFLEDIAREVHPLAQERHAQLEVHGDEVEFCADPDKLRQVILNLISNALKAGADRIWLGSEAIREEGHEDAVLLTVRDNGPGIPEEHLARLFDRFYRVEESRARDKGGSGLGLAITKAIIDSHEGRVWVESEVGQGTTVFVRLPVGEPDTDPEIA